MSIMLAQSGAGTDVFGMAERFLRDRRRAEEKKRQAANAPSPMQVCPHRSRRVLLAAALVARLSVYRLHAAGPHDKEAQVLTAALCTGSCAARCS